LIESSPLKNVSAQQTLAELTPAHRAAKPSPLQRDFSMLLHSVEKLGADLQLLESLQSQFRTKFGQTLPQLHAQQQTLQRQMVLFLHERLQREMLQDAQALTASHRKAMGRVIVSFSVELAMQGDGQMRAIHDQYSHESMGAQDEAQLENMRELLAELGVELPELDDNANALEQAQAALKAIQEKMQQSQEIEDQRRAKREKKRAERKAEKAKTNPTLQAKLASAEQAAQEAQSSLKNIYRQLARQLHPDRAENDAQRVINTDLMSEVNAAYDRQDLLSLLKLQLKAQQIDASAMHTVAEDKLKAWLALLRAQWKELSADVSSMRAQMQYEFRLHPRLPITAQTLQDSLSQASKEYDEVLHTMRSDLAIVQTDAGLKRWAKEQSRLMAEDEHMLVMQRDEMAVIDEVMRDILMRQQTHASSKKKKFR
jgi:hypothetical protein